VVVVVVVFVGRYVLGAVGFALSISEGRGPEPAFQTLQNLSSKLTQTHSPTPPQPAQVRFELGYYALKPDIKVVAPWREWDLQSRTRLIAYAEANGIEVPASKRGEPPFSMDANLLHISYEGNSLEDPWAEAPADMFTRSVSPEQVSGGHLGLLLPWKFRQNFLGREFFSYFSTNISLI
jgi:hypothetical protein